jgi:hypothetical protein
VRHLNKPVYESIPVVYGALGATLLWVSYRYREDSWSTLCAVAGLLGLVAGLMVWMHRRDYRATSADYMQRGRPVGESADDPP